MTSKFCESMLEEACLSWFGGLGFTILHGPEIAPREKSFVSCLYCFPTGALAWLWSALCQQSF
jgi:hypothetical protein